MPLRVGEHPPTFVVRTGCDSTAGRHVLGQCPVPESFGPVTRFVETFSEEYPSSSISGDFGYSPNACRERGCGN